MQYRTQAEVAGTLRGLAHGASAADPLVTGDAAELERIAAWVEGQMETMPLLRMQLERLALAAYSLGARNALERAEAFERVANSPHYDDERVNLGTGEISTVTDTVPCVRCNTPCTACPDCGGQLCCAVCGPDCHTCSCEPAPAPSAGKGAHREQS